MIKNAVSREEVETAIAVVFEEGKKVVKRARTGGFILGALLMGAIAIGAQAYHQYKADEDKKAKEKEKSEEGWI